MTASTGQAVWATVYELAAAGYPELPARALDLCRDCGIAAVSPAGARLLAPSRRKKQYSDVVLISGRGQSRHDVYSAVFDGKKASAPALPGLLCLTHPAPLFIATQPARADSDEPKGPLDRAVL
jgi:hypothetical protein